MNDSSCSMVGLRNSGAVSAMKSVQNFAGVLVARALGGLGQIDEFLDEAERRELARPRTLGGEDDGVAAVAQDGGQADALVRRPVRRLRPEHDRQWCRHLSDDTAWQLSQRNVPARWKSMNTTHARLFGLVAAATGALALTVGTLPAADAAPCPDVEIVFARGTTEPPGVGGIGQAFVDSVRARVGPRSVGMYAVNYPASNDFTTSTPAGANDASAHVQAMARNCPGTRMVLGGYSQGAGVIDMATNAMPPGVAEHVAADALFGAPRSTFADSLAPGPSPVTGPLYVGKTVEECVQNDPICWQSGWDMRAHGAYVQTGLVNQAADYVAGRL